MPPISHEIVLQVDLATTVIALLGLCFSLWLGWRQSRLDVERLRQQRDTDIIRWSDAALAACCNAEMLLTPDYLDATEMKDYERRRFEVLEQISCAIDSGRLYFPNLEATNMGLKRKPRFAASVTRCSTCLSESTMFCTALPMRGPHPRRGRFSATRR